jgi:hypothetical protein
MRVKKNFPEASCRPEDVKTHPIKMFELSGFPDAITAGKLAAAIARCKGGDSKNCSTLAM